MKKIIIAEKPSVAQEYAKVLKVKGNTSAGYIENDDWIVTWTVGHLVTLSYPEKYDVALKEWRLETLPFIPDQFRYEVIEATSRQFNIVKKLYNRADISTIYYAGDAGREGLYIQMLVRMLAGHNPSAEERIVWIDSQTEEEILKGISEARSITDYKAMSDAGYMRAIADYLMGINFSRLLSVLYAVMLNTGSGQKKHMPISVGRVMTCVLGMIVNREREIRKFKVKDFFRIKAVINANGNEVKGEWRVSESSRYYNSPKLYSEFGFNVEKDALELIDILDNRLIIDSVEKWVEKKNAPLLFNLAELQSECTKVLHISPAEALSIAQSLYEKKVTTYPRTDARVISTAVAKEIKKHLEGLKYGAFSSFINDIESKHFNIGGKYVDDSKITDHYAIIPTGKTAKDLSSKEKMVYEMIVRRFLAVFYPAAEFEHIKFEGKSGNELFVGTNKVLLEPGFYKVLGLPEDVSVQEDNENISMLCKGSSYEASYATKKRATAPPKRYTSGSMVLAMENAGNLIEDDELREQIKANGIGTSATRAEIIEKLIRLKYIDLNAAKQILTPTNLGEMVYEVVDLSIPDLLSPEITAEWEKNLEEIAEGVISRKTFETEFYEFIRTKCDEIKANGMQNRDQVKQKIYALSTSRIMTEYKEFDAWNTKIKCPLCGGEVETTAWGFKCKANISKNEGCTFSVSGDIIGHRLLTNELAALLNKGKVGPFYDFISQKNKPFAAYLIWNNEIKKIEFEVTDMPWENTKYNCPVCGKKIQKQGNYYKCEDYVDREHGCSFWLGKVAGKTISEKALEQLLTVGQTDLINGFKNREGMKFDAFLFLDKDKTIKFRFPDKADLQTEYRCPICNGKILATSYGFKCENFKPKEKRIEENGCSFYAGTIMNHAIKEKELKAILGGMETELISFKNNEKVSFDARLKWNPQEKRIEMVFDENKPIETGIKCPFCEKPLLKNKFGYCCSARVSKTEGCQFYIGSVAGIMLDEAQVKKLLEQGKTDLIEGFKPEGKGKKPFSAYLTWDRESKSLSLEFPGREESRQLSSYSCPICAKRLYKGVMSFYCECGFRLNTTIASVPIPEEQIRKLLVYGRSDVINGFFSPKTRKLFSANLVVDKASKKIGFIFPEKPKDGGN